MATQNVLQNVQHYQRSIEKNSGDLARLLHCVGKLYKLPITVDHLQETGVGRTVNELRQHEGELGVAAEAVVNKWKELVTSENNRRANKQSSSDDEHEDHNAYKNDDVERSQRIKNAKSTEQDSQKSEKSSDRHTKEMSTTKSHERHERHKSEGKEKDRSSNKDKPKKYHESKHEESSSSVKEKKEKSESSKHKRRRDDDENGEETLSTQVKERKEQKHKSSRETDKKSTDTSRHHHRSSSEKHRSHDKHNENKKKEETKSKSHSHSEKKALKSDIIPPPPASSASASVDEANTSTTPAGKRCNEETVSKDRSSKKFKTSHTNHESKRSNKQVTGNNETTEAADDDGIDSSMGANFADVLGMLNMPQKKAKKTISALKQTSPTSSKKVATENGNQKTNSMSVLNNDRDFNGPSTSSQVNLEKKPILLTSNVKLAPLDPSIALELPVISNNYRPMPLNPTVMDCVFNSSTSSSSRAPPRSFSDAEALSHGISSKTIRTKVYSGIRSGQLFQPPSLFDACIRVLQKNIDALEYTGGVPFDVLRPVLERATPQQLFTFEEYNPYLMEDSDVLWQQHVARTYRGQKRQEMESWRDMFMRCQEEQDRRLSMLAKNIKHSQKVMAEPVRKTQLAFVDSMVKPPRNVMRKQEQYGTKSKLVATPAARVAALSNVTPNAAKTGDVRLRTAAAIKFDPAQAACAPSRPKKAPLMAKTLQFIRGRQRR